MTVTFKDDEQGYAAWMRANPGGYVFNHFGGGDPAYNVVHRADCRHLRRDADVGARTRYEKVCGETRDEVEAAATRLRASAAGWSHCGSCSQ